MQFNKILQSMTDWLTDWLTDMWRTEQNLEMLSHLKSDIGMMKNGAKVPKFDVPFNYHISSQKQAFDKLSTTLYWLLYFTHFYVILDLW